MPIEHMDDLMMQLDQARFEAKDLAAQMRKLRAENKRLRQALLPMTKGRFWVCAAQVRRACKALAVPVPANALA
jgi:hypothetical protein